MWVCMGVYTLKPEDNLQELVLSSYIGGSGDHTQVIMVSGFSYQESQRGVLELNLEQIPSYKSIKCKRISSTEL